MPRHARRRLRRRDPLRRRGPLLRPGRGVPGLVAAPRTIAPGTITVGSKWGYRYTGDWRMDSHRAGGEGPLPRHVPSASTRAPQLLGPHLGLYQVHSATLESGVLDDAAVLGPWPGSDARGVAVGLTRERPPPGRRGAPRPRGRRGRGQPVLDRAGHLERPRALGRRRAGRSPPRRLGGHRQGGARQRAAHRRRPTTLARPRAAAVASAHGTRLSTRWPSPPPWPSPGPTSCCPVPSTPGSSTRPRRAGRRPTPRPTGWRRHVTPGGARGSRRDWQPPARWRPWGFAWDWPGPPGVRRSRARTGRRGAGGRRDLRC